MGYTNAELMEMVAALEREINRKNAEIQALQSKLFEATQRSRP